MTKPPTEHEANLALAQTLIVAECDSIKELLLEKNRKYGNSALQNVGVFAKVPPGVQIRVRIDDKLKRIQNGNEALEDEDTVLDLIGYLVLLRVEKRYNEGR